MRTNKSHEITFEHKKTLGLVLWGLFEGGKIVKQVAQTVCEGSTCGDIENPTGHATCYN